MTQMIKVTFTDRWHETFAGGHVGLLQVGPVDNSRRPTPLDDDKRELEARLRAELGEKDRATLLAEIPALAVYKKYYRKFSKTYHVQLQLESVLHKGKSLPQVNPLVDACFAAELETQLLTASHDVDKLIGPIAIDASTGEEEQQQMNGKVRTIKKGDMMMTDNGRTVCTIIYGQDQHSLVRPATTNVLYVTYVPAGIDRELVDRHHAAMLANVRRFAPDVDVQLNQITTA